MPKVNDVKLVALVCTYNKFLLLAHQNMMLLNMAWTKKWLVTELMKEHFIPSRAIHTIPMIAQSKIPPMIDILPFSLARINT